MAKQYKNVYTILDKVKKGEIRSYYKDDDGLFGKIDFYKKPDLIKPHMHWLDEDRLNAIMDHHIGLHGNTDKSVPEAYEKCIKIAMSEGKNPPNYENFSAKLRENYRKFPKHIIKDIFKMYYNPMEKLEFEERTEKNHAKFKFLESANNPVAKVMSQGSSLKSAIFARNILTNYLVRMTMLDFTDPEESKKLNNALDGKSEFDNEGLENALNDVLNSKQAKDSMEKAIQEASDLCKNMDNAMDKDIQDAMFKNANKEDSDGTAGQITPDYVNIVSQKLQEVKISLNSVKDKLKKLLDKSISYFSARKEVVYEDLFNSDNISGLEDFELLHPKLRKIFAEDLQVKNTKFVGKIDVYIDTSGSMSSDCGIKNIHGLDISRIDFAKSMVAKLSEINMLNDVYLFDTRVKKSKKDPISIAMISDGGGTNINNAIRNIEGKGVNAIVITDAEDRCDTYSDKVFFIGLEGSNFTHFSPEVIKSYSEKDQVVIFNGQSIKYVDVHGNVVI